jgi:hypothetical protein
MNVTFEKKFNFIWRNDHEVLLKVECSKIYFKKEKEAKNRRMIKALKRITTRKNQPVRISDFIRANIENSFLKTIKT